ncbi:MAG: alkaline phosphatase family protein [Gemmatimonadales bacterium]
MLLATRLGSLSIVAAALACAPAPMPVPVPATGKPTLIVLITIDQMRSDYHGRFASQLTGGLDRLWRAGAVFTDAHHDHAITETAPGHATLLTGRFPRSTGITRNLAGVNDPRWPVIGSEDAGAAPFRLRGTTLFDWLAIAEPATRAFSVSAKDRSAILPIGRSKQQVYWFTNNGLFSTSTWYADSLPDWVTAFNARRIPHRMAGKAWTTLLPDTTYPERDSVPFEAFGRGFTFPHWLPADSTAAAAQFRYTPFVDEITLQFALEGVRRLDLGRGPTTDLLAVSLSATDYVGHFYGPESKEQHDQILRLDRVLGAFLDTLVTLRGRDRMIIVLSADHGGGLIPELHGNLRVAFRPAMAAARAVIRAGGGDSTAVDFESGAVFIDRAHLGTATEAAVIDALVTTARTIPGVTRVDRFADLAGRDLTKDHVARRWLNMFPDDMLPSIVVTLAEGNIFNYPIVATHGSPHDYDSRVPLVFVGSPFKPGRYPAPVRTVDIAPTLARILGIAPTERLDGVPLLAALR